MGAFGRETAEKTPGISDDRSQHAILQLTPAPVGQTPLTVGLPSSGWPGLPHWRSFTSICVTCHSKPSQADIQTRRWAGMYLTEICFISFSEEHVCVFDTSAYNPFSSESWHTKDFQRLYSNSECLVSVGSLVIVHFHFWKADCAFVR